MKFFDRVWEYYLRLRYKIGSRWNTKDDFYLYVNDYICHLKDELDSKIECCQRVIDVCGEPCIKGGEEIIYDVCAGFTGDGNIIECYTVKPGSFGVIPCYNGIMDVEIIPCYDLDGNANIIPCYNFNATINPIPCYTSTFTGAIVYNVGYGTRLAN